MFKTLSHIILTLLLLITTTGMAVSKHFCDELLVSTSFFAETESCCDGDACCHHETEIFQLHEDFQPSLTKEIPARVETEILFSEVKQFSFDDSFTLLHPSFAKFLAPSPPKIQTVLSLKQTYLL